LVFNHVSTVAASNTRNGYPSGAGQGPAWLRPLLYRIQIQVGWLPARLLEFPVEERIRLAGLLAEGFKFPLTFLQVGVDFGLMSQGAAKCRKHGSKEG
jgi:hypothetical protein